MLVHRYYQGKPNPWMYLKQEWPFQRWTIKKNLRLRTRLQRLTAMVGLKK